MFVGICAVIAFLGKGIEFLIVNKEKKERCDSTKTIQKTDRPLDTYVSGTQRYVALPGASPSDSQRSSVSSDFLYGNPQDRIDGQGEALC